MSQEYYDASDVKDAASSKIKTIINDLLPNAAIKGAEARLGSLEGEKGSSCCISVDPSKFGSYFDHATDETGNLIDILKSIRGMDYKEAIEWLGDNYTSCVKRPYEPNKRKERPPLTEAESYGPLSQQVGDYAVNVRHISHDILVGYNVATQLSSPTTAVFLSYDDHKQVAKVAYCATTEKRYWANDGCDHYLFGKHYATPASTKGNLIITEGQWDALSWATIGHPAVSIPSGVSNNKWIDADWEWLKQFHTIYLSYDMDEAGQNAIPEVVKRLGIHKCKIITLPEKDASEMLQQDRVDEMRAAIAEASPPQSSELVSASDLREETFIEMQGGIGTSGDEWFVPDFNIRLREHEMTLVFGPSGNGKSQLVSNQIAYDASKQIQSVIASFEQTSSMTMSSIVRQYSANPRIYEDRVLYDSTYDDLAPFITVYKSTKRTDPDKLIEQFIYAYERKGIKRFIVDNVMSLDANRDDNAEQARIAHVFREFTKNYPISLIVLAHPRKAQPGTDNQQPSKNDIRGASEWQDVPENIITVWRNEKKQQDMELMKNDNRSVIEINHFDQCAPDGMVIVRKQRATGDHPSKNLWFHRDTQRFMIEPGLPLPLEQKVEEGAIDEPF